MGLFIKNLNTNDRQTVSSNRNYANTDSTSYFIQSGVSIFGTLLTKIGDGKGGSGVSDDEKNQLKDKLSSLLTDIGASSASGISDAVSSAKDKSKETIEKNKKETVDIFTNGTDKYSKDIKAKNDELDKLNDKNDPQGIQRNQLKEEIKSLEEAKAKAKSDAEAAQRTLEADEAKKISELQQKADQAQAIADELESIEDPSKYNNKESKAIKEKTSDFSDFNKARDEFLADPANSKKAKKLKKAYNHFDNCPQSVKDAYKLLEEKYPQLKKDSK